MTKGIRVEWRGGTTSIREIEYFCDIDVDDLKGIPAMETVAAFWPREKPTVSLEYNIDVRRKWAGKRELHLFVRYDESRNPHLKSRFHGYDLWGTNKMVLREGKREGHCEWLPVGASKPTRVA